VSRNLQAEKLQVGRPRAESHQASRAAAQGVYESDPFADALVTGKSVMLEVDNDLGERWKPERW
jgi:hypothetical protein